MTDNHLEHWLARALQQRQASGALRRRQLVRPIDATHIEIDGKRFVNFSSNDYLGLSHHPLVKAALSRNANESAGAGASTLMSGWTPEHRRAEESIARWKGTQAALLLPSGYQANVAAIQTFAALREKGGIRFLIDKLVHASLVDAVRGTNQPMRVFGHHDMEKLNRLLEEAERDQLQVVVTESVFSMDGDSVDLPGLAKLKQRHGFALLLDEAHGSGVFGPGGAGLAARMNLTDTVDVSVATFSKALGLMGGAICGNRSFIEAAVNFGRAYIYSTSAMPGLATAIETAITILQNEPERQSRLQKIVHMARSRLATAGWKLPQGDSPIIPVILGQSESEKISAKLAKDGFYLKVIRPPTVRRGEERLRLTLCSEHDPREIEEFLKVLGRAPDGYDTKAV